MSKIKKTFCVLVLLLSVLLVSCGGTDYTEVHDPKTALTRFLEGNSVYTENITYSVNISKEKRTALKEGENPYALIISSTDSRVVPEAIFSLAIGDAKVIKTPGAIVTSNNLAEIERALGKYDISLILVLASDDDEILEEAKEYKITNSDTSKFGAFASKIHDISMDSEDSVERIAVEYTIDELMKLESVKTAIDSGKLGIAGGVYSVSDGTVKIYEEK